MAICEKCGKQFDREEAEWQFENGVDSSFSVSYDQLGQCLCGDCAIEEFENGNYYEICECCGKKFNPDSDLFSFEKQVSHKVLDADMYEFGVNCADCAAEKLLESLEDDDFEDDEDDD